MSRALWFVLWLVAGPAAAEAWQIGGHAKYQFTHTDYHRDDINAVLGDLSANDQDLDLRLKAERRAGPWDFAVHYELLAARGDSVAARRGLRALPTVAGGSTLPDDRRRVFDWTHVLTDDSDTTAVHRLDRLSLGYGSTHGVVRLGRQIVSWGNGLAFHPLDFVNPFSPVAIDKDYKTGDDMLFAQAAIPSGGDVQTIIVPRRDPVTRDLESDQSSYAAKLRRRVGEFDLDFIGARHYDETLLGAGLVRSLGGAVWRLDAGYTDLAQDDGAWSIVTNLDYSWTWDGRNMYGYVEYFRNGVGESARERYPAPNPALAQRLERGELFTLARDYLALGWQIELNPLFNLFTSAIRNLDDGSVLVQLRGVYDWRQDTQLMAGVNLPRGERGDEFGGVPVTGTGAYAGAGRSAYVRAAYYF